MQSANQPLARPQSGTPLDHLASHRRAVIRLSAALYLAGALIAALVSYLPLFRGAVEFVPATVLIVLGGVAAPAVYLFPWHRYPTNLFLVVGMIASAHIAIFLWSTGGTQSPFWPFVVFVVLAATAYYRDRWPLVVLTLLAIAVVASPLLYARPVPDVFIAEVIARAAIIAFSFAVGRWLFRSMDSSVMLAAELQRDHELTERRRQFISVVTHELRGPLTIATGYAELAARRSDLSPEARALLAAQHDGLDRMAALVSDLEESNRIEAGLALNLEEADVATLVGQAAERARLVASGRAIRAGVPAGLPRLRCDPRRVTQVLDNLLANALRYSPAERPVDIECQLRDGSVEFVVRDQGVGIPQEAQPRLFTPFYRADRPAIQKISGTGLGLSICKNLVDAHQGRIWVESQDGKGAAFHFTLPLNGPPLLVS